MAERMAKDTGGNRTPPAWLLYERMDRVRTRQGEWLDALGWGPHETPFRVVLRRPGLTLKAYAGAAGDGPVLLIVPAGVDPRLGGCR